MLIYGTLDTSHALYTQNKDLESWDENGNKINCEKQKMINFQSALNQNSTQDIVRTNYSIDNDHVENNSSNCIFPKKGSKIQGQQYTTA